MSLFLSKPVKNPVWCFYSLISHLVSEDYSRGSIGRVLSPSNMLDFPALFTCFDNVQDMKFELEYSLGWLMSRILGGVHLENVDLGIMNKITATLFFTSMIASVMRNTGVLCVAKSKYERWYVINGETKKKMHYVDKTHIIKPQNTIGKKGKLLSTMSSFSTWWAIVSGSLTEYGLFISLIFFPGVGRSSGVTRSSCWMGSLSWTSRLEVSPHSCWCMGPWPSLWGSIPPSAAS